MGDGSWDLFTAAHCEPLKAASPLHYVGQHESCETSSFVPSESSDAVLSMSPASAMASEDFPTPFCPSRAIFKGPSGPSTAMVGVSSKAWLKLIGEAEGPAPPDIQSQSSWTASSRLSWCLIGRGVLPLRRVGVLDRVILSHCRREKHRWNVQPVDYSHHSGVILLI